MSSNHPSTQWDVTEFWCASETWICTKTTNVSYRQDLLNIALLLITSSALADCTLWSAVKHQMCFYDHVQKFTSSWSVWSFCNRWISSAWSSLFFSMVSCSNHKQITPISSINHPDIREWHFYQLTVSKSITFKFEICILLLYFKL